MDSPKIPTLKDSQKPQVKIRGLEAGVTLFDRLKQFKKKDLAFILAGLGTLFMAPLAEHFMMAPESGDPNLQAGFGGGKGGPGLFSGNGSSPYEPGATGLAPGGAVGGLSDIITPLNVRDPSALVMGPGATQQPQAGSVAPPTPPPTAPVARNDSDLKDALAASARGVGGAAKAAKSLLPVPKVALGGSGLRGLGVSSGGTSASAGLGPISASNVPNKAATGGGLSNVRAVPGYGGVAGGRSGTQGGGGLEGLKKAASDAGERMNQGSASAALNDAANQAIPNGGSGLGGNGAGGTGASDKPDSGNQDKSAKSVGESLDFLKQKAIQEKKIELWAKEQEANDMNLQMAQMRNDALKTIVSDGFAKPLASCIGNIMGGSNCIDPTKTPASVKCEGGRNPGTYPAAMITSSCDKVAPGSKFTMNAMGQLFACPGGTEAYAEGCHRLPAGAPTGDKTPTDQQNGISNLSGVTQKTMGQVGTNCDSIDKISGDANWSKQPQPTQDWLKEYRSNSVSVVTLRDQYGATSVPAAGGCGVTPTAGSVSVKDHIKNVITNLNSNIGTVGQAVGAAPVPAQDDLIGPPAPPSTQWVAGYNQAVAELTAAENQMSGLEKQYSGLSTYATSGKTSNVPPALRQQGGQQTFDWGSLQQSVTGPGGLKEVHDNLQTQLKALRAVVNGDNPNGNLDSVVPMGKTADQVIALRDDFAAKVAKYNTVVKPATPLDVSVLTPKKDAATPAPAAGTPPQSAKVDDVTKAITDAKKPTEALNKRLDAAIAAATPGATPPTGPAPKPITQQDVTDVTTPIMAAVKTQTDNLTTLAADVRNAQGSTTVPPPSVAKP